MGSLVLLDSPRAVVGCTPGLFIYSCVDQVNGPLAVAGVLPLVSFWVLRAVGLCAASPVVEAARTHLAASVTRWYGQELVR